MYRIFILSLLAIVFGTFALEPSQVILRATEIGGNTIALEWFPIEGAKSYKVFYDEESLINPNAPDPILESASTDKTAIRLDKMMEGAEYYLIVYGLDEKGEKIGSSIPLHASTLRSPLFTLKESKTINDQTISLTFSHPIDIKNTQIEILNTETKKPRTFKEITVSSEDLRIVNIVLEGKLAPGMSHDIVLKKVVDLSGSEMSPESKKTTTIIFSSLGDVVEPVKEESKETLPTPSDKLVIEPIQEVVPPPVPEIPKDESEIPKALPPVEAVAQPDAALEALQEKTEELGIERVEASVPLDSPEPEKTPVVIDRLPQTGPSNFILLGIALLVGICLSYKKRTSL